MQNKWRNHTGLLGFIFATGLLFGSGAAQATTYRNMISDGDAPDPGVLYVSGSVGGASNEYLGATTNNPPGYIRIYRSANLHTLFRDAHVDIALPSGVGGLWAPELHTFPSYPGLWLYFTGLESAGTYTWVFEITNLNTGAWNNHGRVVGLGSNYDFSIFERSSDGTLWGFFAFGNEHLEAVRMSNPYTAQGNTLREIYTATRWWESTMAGIPPFVEAPFPFEKNGKIFLSYSAAAWKWDAYCLGVLRWDGPVNGNLTHRSWTNLTGDTGPAFSSANGLYATGHNSIVKVRNGDYWNVYHAHTESCGNSCNRANLPRYAGMNKVEWDGSGNPVFGAPTGTSTDVEIPDNGSSGKIQAQGNTSLCLGADSYQSALNLHDCNSGANVTWTQAGQLFQQNVGGNLSAC
jgi:GH43 family beta-xylosidase